VVTYQNTAERVQAGIRPQDRLWVRDNTWDNIGFSRAANELAAQGTQPVILFVNPDGDPQPGCFDRLESSILEDPEIVAIAANQGPAWGPPSEDWLPAACLAVSRDAFEEVGCFDETFFMYAEDVDLSWKLARIGRLSYCAEAEFWHDRGYQSFRATFWQTRNTFRVYHRWGRPRSLGAMFRGALGNLRDGRWKVGVGRLAALAVFVILDDRGPRHPEMT
jgi:GT2 family glycosyltransferase